VLVLLSVSNISYYEFTRAGAGHRTKAPEPGAGTGHKGLRPNIYYIVMDAYASDDVLKEMYGYDNSAFIGYLKEKGFYVAGASTSNYTQTGLSLASTFNMDYMDDLIRHLDIDSQDASPLKNLIRNSKVFEFLRRRGYTIAALSSGCAESEIGTADIYICPGWMPDEFQNMLIGTTPIPLIPGFFGSPDQYDIHTNRILFEFERLADTEKLKEPFFLFAHIAIPHPPFVFGPDGEKLKPGLIFHNEDGDSLIRRGRLTKNQYMRGYTDQLTFANRKLEKTLNAILAGSINKPVIILQADHGARSGLLWEDPGRTDMRECMSILNAYYLPGGGEKLIYKNITPVNTFRVIFNYYFGMDHKLLEDRNFFSTEKHPYRFIDVTEAAQKR
jgi:hypothetical protein